MPRLVPGGLRLAPLEFLLADEFPFFVAVLRGGLGSGKNPRGLFSGLLRGLDAGPVRGSIALALSSAPIILRCADWIAAAVPVVVLVMDV